jgi:hypothetical protein
MPNVPTIKTSHSNSVNTLRFSRASNNKLLTAKTIISHKYRHIRDDHFLSSKNVSPLATRLDSEELQFARLA